MLKIRKNANTIMLRDTLETLIVKILHLIEIGKYFANITKKHHKN